MNDPLIKKSTNVVGRRLFAALLILSALAIFTGQIMLSIKFKQNVKGHLKLAADANIIAMAAEELDHAIAYLEAEGLTEGYTSVIYDKPTEDIGFWYRNLKASRAELERAKDGDQLLQTNTLIKLRETLLDGGGDGDRVTIPDGLSRYPNNLWWGLGTLYGLLIAIPLGIYFMFTPEQWKAANQTANANANAGQEL